MEARELRRVFEGNESHASVELSGVLPGSIDPGTCHRRYSHFLRLRVEAGSQRSRASTPA